MHTVTIDMKFPFCYHKCVHGFLVMNTTMCLIWDIVSLVYILYIYVTSTTKWPCHEMLTMASVLVVYYAEKKLTYLVATILVLMNNVVLHVVVQRKDCCQGYQIHFQ